MLNPAYLGYSSTARRHEAMVSRESRTGRSLPAHAWSALSCRWGHVTDRDDIDSSVRQKAEDRRLEAMARWCRELDRQR